MNNSDSKLFIHKLSAHYQIIHRAEFQLSNRRTYNRIELSRLQVNCFSAFNFFFFIRFSLVGEEWEVECCVRQETDSDVANNLFNNQFLRVETAGKHRIWWVYDTKTPKIECYDVWFLALFAKFNFVISVERERMTLIYILRTLPLLCPSDRNSLMA